MNYDRYYTYCPHHYLVVLRAPYWRVLVLFIAVPTGGGLRGQGRQFVQQVSVQLLSLRQCNLQQEPFHHQLLQLRAKCCGKIQWWVQKWNKREQQQQWYFAIKSDKLLLDTDPEEEQTGALYKRTSHLFDSDVKIFWFQISPETVENNQ